MVTALVMMVLTQTPECRTSGMQTACGFHCRAELDEVKCAQTPQGRCERIERRLVCWDPPDEVRFHEDAGIPGAPVCRAKYRDVACGYACVTSPNKLACAQTPWGVCATRHDDVHCWDPKPEVIHAFVATKQLGGAKCVQTDSGFACGWDCKRSYQDVQCAQSPVGRCSVFEGRITCFEPPLPPVTHAP